MIFTLFPRMNHSLCCVKCFCWNGETIASHFWLYHASFIESVIGWSDGSDENVLYQVRRVCLCVCTRIDASALTNNVEGGALRCSFVWPRCHTHGIDNSSPTKCDVCIYMRQTNSTTNSCESAHTQYIYASKKDFKQKINNIAQMHTHSTHTHTNIWSRAFYSAEIYRTT